MNTSLETANTYISFNTKNVIFVDEENFLHKSGDRHNVKQIRKYGRILKDSFCKTSVRIAALNNNTSKNS